MKTAATRTDALLQLLGGRRERPPTLPEHQADEKARLKAAYQAYELVAHDAQMEGTFR